MYIKRITLENYGPIDKFDVAFPFARNRPRPVVLVGENGSGKSIVLSHLVDALLSAQGIVYPETPEVDPNKVYRIRSPSYIRTGREYYFAKVAFFHDLSVTDIRTSRLKRDYDAPPMAESSPSHEAWVAMADDEHQKYTSFNANHKTTLTDLFSTNCVLYFPHNRFEEAAWLNEDNLRAKAQYMHLTSLQDHTNRRVVTYSPLRENQDWLFDLLYDARVLETTTEKQQLFRRSSEGMLQPGMFEVVTSRLGRSDSFYTVVLDVLQDIVGHSEQRIRFGIGTRHARRVAVMSADSPNTTLVPNIFQLSSGEGALLNLFLSILRDFDLSNAPFSGAADVRGIVIVDEVDLHLHTNQQRNVLPKLIQMLPNVQFIVTTHSPLFVLGMTKRFGKRGLGLYELPGGREIDAEGFREFESAHRAFSETQRFAREVQERISALSKVGVFVDGPTDVDYLQAAARCLGRDAVFERCEIIGAGGESKLRNIWNTPGIAQIVPDKIILIHDCDSQIEKERRGGMYRFSVRQRARDDHPIDRGVEHLFDNKTMKKVREFTKKVTEEEWVNGQPTVRVRIGVRNSEKRKLCDWLCKNGTRDDFRHFGGLLDIIEAILEQRTTSEENEFPDVAGGYAV